MGARVVHRPVPGDMLVVYQDLFGLRAPSCELATVPWHGRSTTKPIEYGEKIRLKTSTLETWFHYALCFISNESERQHGSSWWFRG